MKRIRVNYLGEFYTEIYPNNTDREVRMYKAKKAFKGFITEAIACIGFVGILAIFIFLTAGIN